MSVALYPDGDLRILREQRAHEMAVIAEAHVLPISVRQANGHADADIFGHPAIEDPASVLALLMEIDAKPVMFALKIHKLLQRVDAQQESIDTQRDHLETLEDRLAGLSARVGA